MGEMIGLDHGAVLGDIKLYVVEDEVRKMFEQVLLCYRLEQELRNEFS